MATYQELYDIYNNNELLQKITIAVAVAADTIINESDQTTNHANRMIWAKEALSDATGMARRMQIAVLAANKDATVNAINTASDATVQTAVDATVQTAVDATVNTFATGA